MQIQFSNFIKNLPERPRLRLAPTPSGFLHIGNALNFTLNWLAVRSRPAGKLLLRIDDLDAERKRPEFLEDIFRTLDWLQIQPDEGPSTPDDFERNWSQRHRLDLYEKLLNSLKINDLIFACGKSRKELAAFGNEYPPEFRGQNLPLDSPDVAWRIKTPDGFPLPDFVVRRRDRKPAYQIASLADDVFFKITHLVRGQDLENSSLAQNFLAEKLGLTDFQAVEIFHHPLVKNAAGEKLSKTDGADSLKSLREAGLTRAAFFEKMAGWLDDETASVLLKN